MNPSYNPFSLTDKTILVTGASSGIGQCTAVEAAKMGAHVLLSARDEQRLHATQEIISNQADTDSTILPADLTDTDQLEHLVDQCPKLDGLMLCAGRGLTTPIQYSTREKFDEIFEVNFFAQVELLRLLYKKKKLIKHASVVIVASLGGTQIFSGGNGIYGASKAALNAIMKFAAKEYALRRVRVNSICPGMVDTPLIHRGTVSEEQLAADQQRYPLGRYGRPEDIAHAAIYLLSEASSWLTGQSLVIDGGVSIK